MFSSLKVKNFRLYWIGMFISFIGSSIETVAQSWLVFQLTKSSFLLGLVGFLGMVPIFVLSLLGGAVADRVNKRMILLITQHIFMILAFILAVLTQLNLVTPSQIMIIALLNGIVLAFDAPARQAMIVELVGKQHLFNAIAWNSAAFNSARLIGPALAAILVSMIGMSGCFYINGISFIAVIVGLYLIKVIPSGNKNKKTVMSQDIYEGLKFVVKNKLIFILISMVAFISIFGLAYIILMPVIVQDMLHTDIKGMGMLMSASGLGALVAALMLARLTHLKKKGALLLFSYVLFSVILIIFSFSKVFTLSLALLVVIGWSSVMGISLVNNALQILAPDEFRGRVMGVFMLVFLGLAPFGSLLSGYLSHIFGVSFTLMLNGIICCAYFTGVFLLCPQVRRM